jgi:hypothetical protein
MSNALAIATVTFALRTRIDTAVNDADAPGQSFQTDVSAVPPDSIDTEQLPHSRVNVFLYNVTPNAAWRNRDLPAKTNPAESGIAPLALSLNYLITVYAPRTDGVVQNDHVVLGRVMNALQESPVFTRDELRHLIDQNPDALLDSDLDQQAELVRLTPQALSIEEWSKIWTAIQKPARLSVAYEASPVLIDSTRPVHSALPVLGRRTVDDLGFVVTPSMGLPILESASPPQGARIGDTLVFHGIRLGAVAQLQFSNPLLPSAAILPVPDAGRTSSSLAVVVPAEVDQEVLPAGLYSVSAQVPSGTVPGTNPPVTRFASSNTLAIAILPTIATTPGQPLEAVEAAGRVTLTLTLAPPVFARQLVTLLLAGTSTAAPVRTGGDPMDSVEFDLTNVTIDPTVSSYARVRVDGVDSLPYDPTRRPPAFDPDLAVELPRGGGP